MRPDAVAGIIYTWAVNGDDPYMKDIDQVIKERGWAPLNDIAARVMCAINNDKQLVGFHVLQLFPHCEPLWVHPDYLGTSIAAELADRMMAFMMGLGARGFMVIADSPHAEKLCKAHGMKRVTSPVYVI